MTDIKQVRCKIEKLYNAIEGPTLNAPLEFQAYEWAHFAGEYIGAASILDKEESRYMLPKLQLTGHAIECSLKACLAAANSDPPSNHDLVQLYELAAMHGFQLDEKSLAMIVHLNHYYFRDLATDTKFKARYPTKTSEGLGGAIPGNSTFVSIVRLLIEQAALRASYPFREMFNTLRT